MLAVLAWWPGQGAAGQEPGTALKWMADRLKMGPWAHMANRLYHLKK
jgi:hypothetical protein